MQCCVCDLGSIINAVDKVRAELDHDAAKVSCRPPQVSSQMSMGQEIFRMITCLGLMYYSVNDCLYQYYIIAILNIG